MTARSFLVPANPRQRVGCVTPQMWSARHWGRPWDIYSTPSGPYIAGGGIEAARARRMQVELRRVERRRFRRLRRGLPSRAENRKRSREWSHLTAPGASRAVRSVKW